MEQGTKRNGYNIYSYKDCHDCNFTYAVFWRVPANRIDLLSGFVVVPLDLFSTSPTSEARRLVLLSKILKG